MSNLKTLIAKAADGNALSREEARQAFDTIMSGAATPSQIGGFLMAPSKLSQRSPKNPE